MVVLLRKQLKNSEDKTRLGGIEEVISQANDFNGHYLLVLQTSFSSKELREVSDILRNHYKSCVLILTAIENGKIGALVAVTTDLVELGFSARSLTSALTTLTGGKGGGRPELAQAGGCDPAKLGDALVALEADIKNQLESLGK